METLTRRDQAAALKFLRDAYAICDFDKFVEFVLQALPTLIQSELTSYSEIQPRAGRSFNWVAPEQPPDVKRQRDAAWLRVMHEHPAMNHYLKTRGSRVEMLSDFLTPRQLRNMALYSEHYGPLGRIIDVIPIFWGSSEALNAVGLHRRTKFNGRDKAIADLIRPHLIQAHANAVAFSKVARAATLLEKALDASARALVVLRRDRRIEFAMPIARNWMRDYFGAADSIERLPEPLDLWVRQHDSAMQQILDLPRPRDPLVVNRQNRRLVIGLISGEERLLLLLEEQNMRIDVASIRALGLSNRESQVLAGMSNGLSKVEIARVLAISPRTVDTHLQRVYQRLGVSSRNAAAAEAFRASRVGVR